MKRCQIIWAGLSPLPLSSFVWTETKRTAAFSQDTFPNITLSPSLTGLSSELWCSSGRSSDPGPTFPRTPESAYSSSTKSYLRSLHETYYTKILHICQNCYYQNMLSFPKRSLRIYEWTIRQPHSFHKQWKGLGRIEDLYTHCTPYLCVVRLDKEYLFSILL